MDHATDLLNRLRRITMVKFIASSEHDTRWNGFGSGVVTTRSREPDFVHFTEHGMWQPNHGLDKEWGNVLVWTMLAPDRIQLQHLRWFGPEHPLDLFELVMNIDGIWEVVIAPHNNDDCWSVDLQVFEDGVNVRESATGLRKSQTIIYEYR